MIEGSIKIWKVFLYGDEPKNLFFVRTERVHSEQSLITTVGWGLCSHLHWQSGEAKRVGTAGHCAANQISGRWLCSQSDIGQAILQPINIGVIRWPDSERVSLGNSAAGSLMSTVSRDHPQHSVPHHCDCSLGFCLVSCRPTNTSFSSNFFSKIDSH